MVTGAIWSAPVVALTVVVIDIVIVDYRRYPRRRTKEEAEQEQPGSNREPDMCPVPVHPQDQKGHVQYEFGLKLRTANNF